MIVYAVFGSRGFMDSQKGPLLAIFDNHEEASKYANQMMGFVDHFELLSVAPKW